MYATPAIGAQIAQSRTEFAVSAIKQNANAEKRIADMLQSAAANVPSDPIRGTNVNVKA